MTKQRSKTWTTTTRAIDNQLELTMVYLPSRLVRLLQTIATDEGRDASQIASQLLLEALDQYDSSDS